MTKKKPVPDCESCWKRETCENARDGAFCPAWQSKEPKIKGIDPNTAWERGDDPWQT